MGFETDKTSPRDAYDFRYSTWNLQGDRLKQATDALAWQLEQHENIEQSDSALTKIIHLFDDGSKQKSQVKSNLDQLSKLTAGHQDGHELDARLLYQSVDEAAAARIDDQSHLHFKQFVDQYLPGMAKTACLFLPEMTHAKTFLGRKFGLLATAAVYALDEWKPASSLNEQATDFGLGALKGIALKGVFSKLPQIEPRAKFIPEKWLPKTGMKFHPAVHGVFLGQASRAVETVLSRNTYLDEKTQKTSLNATIQHYQQQLLNPAFIATDLAGVGLTKGLQKHLGISRDAVRTSPFMSTYLTSASFGFVNGASHELHEQSTTKEHLSLESRISNVLQRGVIQGLCDSFAAVPAAGLTAHQMARNFKHMDIKTPIILDEKTLESRFQSFNAKEGKNPNADFHSWSPTGVYNKVTCPTQVYDVKGYKFQVLVPKHTWDNKDGQDVAKRHNTLLDPNNGLPDQSAIVSKHKIALLQYLDELPRAGLIRKIELRGDEYRSNNVRAAASAGEHQSIEFWEQPSLGIRRDTVFHEWAHVLHNDRPADLTTFQHAMEIESKGYYFNKHSKTNVKENWAVHLGEVFLAPDVNSFLALARKAPLRTVVLARSIEATMLEIPASERGLYGQQFLDRARLIRQELEPLAKHELAKDIADGKGTTAMVQLLAELGKPISTKATWWQELVASH